MSAFEHSYPFDPTYGYTLESLLEVESPSPPDDFFAYWERRRERALAVDPKPELEDLGTTERGFRAFDAWYRSTDGARIGGWLLLPADGEPKRGFVVGHGYGGRSEPDFGLPFPDAAIWFPCLRGLSRSALPGVPAESGCHVVHGIEDRDAYIHGGCVEDVWTAASALLQTFPHLEDHIGYIGGSFGGGIGALALPLDRRYRRAHLKVPSFGNAPLRMRLETVGSGASVQAYEKRHPSVALKTLAYYDAAVAATRLRQPTHFACALFDPAVAPPGQFAVYNAAPCEKRLFVLEAGHYEYPGQPAAEARLKDELADFFAGL